MTERLGKFLSCPSCGYRMDQHTAIGSTGPLQPKPGDAGICIRCGQLLRFELDMVGLRFRLPTVLELVEMRADTRIEKALEAWVSAFHRTPEMRTS